MCQRSTDWLPLTCPQLGTWPATQTCALTRNGTSDLSICRRTLNPRSPTPARDACLFWSSQLYDGRGGVSISESDPYQSECSLEGYLGFCIFHLVSFLLLQTSKTMASLLLDKKRKTPWVETSARFNSAPILFRHLCGPDMVFRHSEVPVVCHSHATHGC